MKVNEWICDICGKDMGCRDFQHWIKKRPNVKFGYPAFEMKRMDICSKCFVELCAEIMEKRKEKVDFSLGKRKKK